MTNDCIAQTWYRFLRTIGSPIALCSPQVISNTPQFMQWVATRADGVEAFQHPCLLQLPHIFLKAIKGIASQVDAFLGMIIGNCFVNPHHFQCVPIRFNFSAETCIYIKMDFVFFFSKLFCKSNIIWRTIHETIHNRNQSQIHTQNKNTNTKTNCEYG